MRIAQQSPFQDLKRTAELQRKGCGDRCVPCVCIKLRARFVILEEDFGNAAIEEAADRRGVAQTRNFDFESFGQAALWRSIAMRRRFD